MSCKKKFTFITRPILTSLHLLLVTLDSLCNWSKASSVKASNYSFNGYWSIKTTPRFGEFQFTPSILDCSSDLKIEHCSWFFFSNQYQFVQLTMLNSVSLKLTLPFAMIYRESERRQLLQQPCENISIPLPTRSINKVVIKYMRVFP